MSNILTPETLVNKKEYKDYSAYLIPFRKCVVNIEPNFYYLHVPTQNFIKLIYITDKYIKMNIIRFTATLEKVHIGTIL